MQRSALWLLVAAGLSGNIAARASTTELTDPVARAIDGPAFTVDPSHVPGDVRSLPKELVSAGGWVYFTAQTPASGRELWRTDCTAAGTVLAVELDPGDQRSRALEGTKLTPVGDLVFFEHAFSGQLWRSGGTLESTFAVSREPSLGFSPYSSVGALGDKAIFLTYTGLSRSDGTVDGTVELVNLHLYNNPTDSKFLVADGVAYFAYVHYDEGVALWKTDGTTTGTRQIAKPLGRCGGLGLPDCREWLVPLAAIEGRVFFVVWPESGNPQLWIYVPGLGPRLLTTAAVAFAGATRVGDLLLFAADDGEHGMELWRSDGTADGTYMLSDLVPGPAGSSLDWERDRLGHALGAVLLFAATGPAGNRIMWRSDGSAEGTAPIDSSTAASTIVRLGPTLADALYVQAEDEISGNELWKVTASAMDLVVDLLPGSAGSNPVIVTVLEDRLYFLADSTGSGGSELWRTDGSRDGTVRAGDVQFLAATDPPEVAHCARGFAFSIAGELGIFDGNTGMLTHENIAVDFSSPAPSILAKTGDLLVFKSADDVRLTDGRSTQALGINASGAAVWNDQVYLDGTTVDSGTELVAANFAGDVALVHDIVPGSASSFPRELTASRNGIFFVAAKSVWFSDGTMAGTHPLTTPGSNSPSGLTNLEDVVYFQLGGALWRSNGTTDGTRQIALSGALSSLGPMTLFKDRLFFAAWSFRERILGSVGPSGRATIAPVSPENIVAVDELLYFSGPAQNGDDELWRSDGTTDGTWLVKEINAQFMGPYRSPLSSSPSDFVGHPGGTLFAADDGIHGRELWRTDGTPAGTTMVHDIYPGDRGSDPTELIRIGTRVVFAAQGPEGRELWESDGTSAGTRLFADLLPGNLPSSPRQLTTTRSHLYFTAYDTNSTRQLWAMPLGESFFCKGDCNQSGTVTVEELVLLGNIALGDAAIDQCQAGDFDEDGGITVDEIVGATRSALGGCEGE